MALLRSSRWCRLAPEPSSHLCLVRWSDNHRMCLFRVFSYIYINSLVLFQHMIKLRQDLSADHSRFTWLFMMQSNKIVLLLNCDVHSAGKSVINWPWTCPKLQLRMVRLVIGYWELIYAVGPEAGKQLDQFEPSFGQLVGQLLMFRSCWIFQQDGTEKKPGGEHLSAEFRSTTYSTILQQHQLEHELS